MDAEVSYSIKELLDQIKTSQTEGFAQIKTALVAKADKADVARLEARLDQHAVKISTLEMRNHDREISDRVLDQRDQQSWSWRKRIMAALGSLGLIIATVLGPYFGTHLHF